MTSNIIFNSKFLKIFLTSDSDKKMNKKILDKKKKKIKEKWRKFFAQLHKHFSTLIFKGESLSKFKTRYQTDLLLCWLFVTHIPNFILYNSHSWPNFSLLYVQNFLLSIISKKKKLFKKYCFLFSRWIFIVFTINICKY